MEDQAFQSDRDGPMRAPALQENSMTSEISQRQQHDRAVAREIFVERLRSVPLSDATIAAIMRDLDGSNATLSAFAAAVASYWARISDTAQYR